MKSSFVLRSIAIPMVLAGATQAITAQNSIPIFSPVVVRASAEGTGNGPDAVTFNSATLNLDCPSSGISAVLSSSSNGWGNVLADNFIDLTTTYGTTSMGPVNACLYEKSEDTPGAVYGNCFTGSYQWAANAGKLTGQDPDSFVTTGGVAPIDISSKLRPGKGQVKIDLMNTGGHVASSTIYLDTNCTADGVTGPASLTGNPIPQTAPTSQQLTQNFPFNPISKQQVKFVYDLSQAQAAGSLSITQGTIPKTQDLPADPTTFQAKFLADTPFATSSCIVHTGELIEQSGDLVPACKLYTLECSVGTGATASGAQCPVSSLPNEVFQDIFDGPSFTLPDIPTPNGPTFHQGVGFLMASEGWTGGPCTFDPASGLQDLPCPQNMLTTFSGPGLYVTTGGTSHPNSTFIAVMQVPEDLTTVTVAHQQPGGWINTRTANFTLSSQPPVLKGTNLPGAASFIASPIQNITYGISPASQVPSPSAPPSTDTVVQNNITCPLASNPLDPPAAVFATGPQTITVSQDGKYLLHYYAQDCAGSNEFSFIKDPTGNWSTNFYTVPIDVDTVAPVVASGPTLSPAAGNANSYTVGQAVSANYSCTDELSGLVRCGTATFSYTAGTLNSGPISSPVDTSSPGNKTYTVMAVDAAGNRSSASVQYTVAPAYDSAIEFRLGRSTVTYREGVRAFIRIAPTNGHVPTGMVRIYDGTIFLRSAWLRRGMAHLHIRGLAVGVHELSAVYSGDAFNPGGRSAPVTLTVKPGDDDDFHGGPSHQGSR